MNASAFVSLFFSMVFERVAFLRDSASHLTPFAERLLPMAEALRVDLVVTKLWECAHLLTSWKSSPVVAIVKVGSTSKIYVNDIMSYTLVKTKQGYRFNELYLTHTGSKEHDYEYYPTRDDALDFLLNQVWG